MCQVCQRQFASLSLCISLSPSPIAGAPLRPGSGAICSAIWGLGTGGLVRSVAAASYGARARAPINACATAARAWADSSMTCAQPATRAHIRAWGPRTIEQLTMGARSIDNSSHCPSHEHGPLKAAEARAQADETQTRPPLQQASVNIQQHDARGLGWLFCCAQTCFGYEVAFAYTFHVHLWSSGYDVSLTR